jgi:uncharacterized protein
MGREYPRAVWRGRVARTGRVAYAGCMTPTIEQLRKRREQIIALASAHGARNVRVFGSVARGDATFESDVDLVVDFDAGRSLLDHGALIMDLQETLGCRVDVVSSKGLRERFRDRVFADAVPL